MSAHTISFAELEPGRRGEILDAAFAVFCERGYEGGSMREIATRIGVTEPALYRHFTGKEDLFLALMRAVSTRMVTTSERLIDSFTAEDLSRQLADAFTDRRSAVLQFAPAFLLFLTTAARDPRFVGEYRSMMIVPLHARMSAKIREIDAAMGNVRAGAEHDARVRSLISLFIGYMVTSVVLGPDDDASIGSAALRLMEWDA